MSSRCASFGALGGTDAGSGGESTAAPRPMGGKRGVVKPGSARAFSFFPGFEILEILRMNLQ